MSGLLDARGDVRDWAPPGWHWEPAPEEVVRRRIREEDEHVNRYVFMLDTPAVYNSRWMVLRRDPSHVSIAPIMVPALWVRSSGRSAPRGFGPCKS